MDWFVSVLRIGIGVDIDVLSASNRYHFHAARRQNGTG